MLMKREIHKRTPQEKEKILLDIQSLGVTVRKINILTIDVYAVK